MLAGAIAVLITGQITPAAALKSINLDVILFLFGMFVVGQALEESGYLAHLSYTFFKRAKTLNHLLILILFIFGISSAFLMNDTLAIIGTPVVLLLAKQHKIHAKILLLALAFSVTIGSVISPIGNPQNLLIAIDASAGMKQPFLDFLKYLFIPTMINLIVCFFVLKLFYNERFHNNILAHSQEPIKDHALTQLSKLSLGIIIILIFLKIIFVNFDSNFNLGFISNFDFKLTYIALGASLPILLFSRKRVKILKEIDWHTLIFFCAMFIMMESVWETGFFQAIIQNLSINIISIPAIFAVSILLSQLISNVPLVALYLPMLTHAGASIKALAALAAGSTIAGNLLILGAASNIIIIQNAEKRSAETITFWEFAKVGLPLTILNTAVYLIFLR